jgi:hypothetical protein
MKVICQLNFREQFTTTRGKTWVEFDKGKVYDTAGSYGNTYLFLLDDEIILVSSVYFLSIDQVFKRKLLSFQKEDYWLTT